MSVFLDDNDVARLTGRKLKSAQIDVLRTMGIAFHINASGRPIVPLSSIGINNNQIEPIDKSWSSNALKHGQKTS